MYLRRCVQNPREMRDCLSGRFWNEKFLYQPGSCFSKRIERSVQRWNSWTSIWLKTQVFCSMLFTVSYTFQILHHTIYTLLRFWKSIQKNPWNKKTSVFLWIAICRTEKGVEYQTKTRVWEERSSCLDTSTKNAVQEFLLRICSLFTFHFRGFDD